ncbi:MAG TPA: amidohydrolase family protein, partial [Rugosimonospora sp.]|nr:amidohydrolase family protein [Rugosimonospora sp.]
MIVDAQVHVWDEGTQEHAAAVLHRALGPDGVLAAMDGAGVGRAVVVPPGRGPNDFSLSVAAAHPDRFAVMGVIRLDKPSGRELVAGWASRPAGLLGIRLSFPPWRPSSWLTDGTSDWFWPAAEAAGIPVMVWAPRQIPAVRDIAVRHPGLRIIVDHMGLYVDVRDDDVAAAVEPVYTMADLPNVGVKLTALPCHTSEPYPFTNLHPHVRRMRDTFGNHRLFWGSDMTRLPVPYSQCVTAFTEQMPFLTATDLERIMGR